MLVIFQQFINIIVYCESYLMRLNFIDPAAIGFLSNWLDGPNWQ